MALVNDIQALNPLYNKWYMDDGGIIGDVDLLKKVWDLLQTRGPALGLHFALLHSCFDDVFMIV